MNDQSFHPLDAGTHEDVWETHFALNPAPPLTACGRGDTLVVVAAHPDDETLGAAGFLHLSAYAGATVHVIVATNGDASHPHSPTHTPENLADLRRREVRAALSHLAPTAHVQFLDLPDGHLNEHVEALTAAIVKLIGALGERSTILSPWGGDRHPDHAAASEAARIAGLRTDAAVLQYPIWLWHWGVPNDLPEDGVTCCALPAPVQNLKREAIAIHRSQTHPLSDAPGDEEILPAHVITRFLRTDETFFAIAPEQRADGALDALHATTEDPWNLETSPYEISKRDTLLRCLPQRRFRRAIEVGCSSGALTAALAARADAVVAIDSSSHAVTQARRRLGSHPNVEVLQGHAPVVWPEGDGDLVVISEVGYFLSPAHLDRLADRVATTLTDGGVVALCYWRPAPHGWPLHGDAVHDRWISRWCRQRLDFSVQHSRTEPLFRIDVLTLGACPQRRNAAAPLPGVRRSGPFGGSGRPLRLDRGGCRGARCVYGRVSDDCRLLRPGHSRPPAGTQRGGGAILRCRRRCVGLARADQRFGAGVGGGHRRRLCRPSVLAH